VHAWLWERKRDPAMSAANLGGTRCRTRGSVINLAVSDACRGLEGKWNGPVDHCIHVHQAMSFWRVHRASGERESAGEVGWGAQGQKKTWAQMGWTTDRKVMSRDRWNRKREGKQSRDWAGGGGTQGEKEVEDASGDSHWNLYNGGSEQLVKVGEARE
jgi:hypothetical protein